LRLPLLLFSLALAAAPVVRKNSVRATKGRLSGFLDQAIVVM
jgi:hypothetical protein